MVFAPTVVGSAAPFAVDLTGFGLIACTHAKLLQSPPGNPFRQPHFFLLSAHTSRLAVS